MSLLKTSAVVIMFSASALILAADYPSALVGAYVGAENMDKNACNNPLVVVQKNARYNIEDAECRATKVSSNGSQHVITEKCGREGSAWTQTTTFDLGAVISFTEQSKYQGKSTLKLRSCSTTLTPVTTAASAAGAAKSCTVIQGQAGVATYLDDKLTKLATDPIRDFDGYTFKAEKVVTVNKIKLLVGKLLRADGTVGRGTYAIEEEWECK